MTQDIFVPESKPEDALAGQLNTITYVTSSPDEVTKALVEGLGLQSTRWLSPEAENKAPLNDYLGFANDESWKACLFFRNDQGANIRIRVIHVSDQTPQVRPELHGNYLGGATIGFPMKNTEAREAKMASAGFPSSVGVKRLEFSSPTGETYISEEVHFPAPENIYLLGVNRPDIFVPVGPIQEDAEIGAAAYSAICVADSEATKDFYGNVLGYEFRRDMSMPVGPGSGLGQTEGSAERFIQAFAPGSSTGYLVFLDHSEDRITLDPPPSFGPISRGLTMWSFPTDNIDEVHRRAVAANVDILHGPTVIESPFLPRTKTLLMRDPGGCPIEVFAQ